MGYMLEQNVYMSSNNTHNVFCVDNSCFYLITSNGLIPFNMLWFTSESVLLFSSLSLVSADSLFYLAGVR